MAVTIIKNYSRKIAGSKPSNTGMIIGVSLLVGTAVGLVIWHFHNKKKAELAAKNSTTPPASTSGSVTNAISSLGNAAANILSTGSTKPPVTTTIGSSTNPISVQSNAPDDTLSFQKWANKNKGTNLTEDGLFGPKTKAAWGSYGMDYTNATNLKMIDFDAFKKSGGAVIGKTVYSKYGGGDIFDGNTADNTFNKVAVTTKAQALGRVAKLIPTTAGANWVVFSGPSGKFYKMYSTNLNILA